MKMSANRGLNFSASRKQSELVRYAEAQPKISKKKAALLIPGNARVRERLGLDWAMWFCGALPLYKRAALSGRERFNPDEYPG